MIIATAVFGKLLCILVLTANDNRHCYVQDAGLWV